MFLSVFDWPQDGKLYLPGYYYIDLKYKGKGKLVWNISIDEGIVEENLWIMEERQITYSNIPMEISVLREAVSEYRAQNNRISNMERSGDLIRVRRGLYVADPRLSNQEISRELIANNLYGPSYVSFESALSYHGHTPERVNAVSSATIRRARSYTTPLGLFEFVTVPRDYFHIGIEQIIVENQYAFLIASPEKAICDLTQLVKNATQKQKKSTNFGYFIL